MKTKLISIIIYLSLLTTTVSAQTVVNSGTTGPLTWTLYSDGTLNISGNGNMPDYDYSSSPWYSFASNIKTIVLTNGVKSIGSNAFYNCSSLTSITIPNNVTSIGNNAFYNCSSLTSITIPNGVTSIGEGAFSYCSSLTSITIPNNVTSIGAATFGVCSSLTSITIPNGVTSIGANAFSGCSSLTSVIISNSVTSICESAFYNCSSLTSIIIPNSVTSIGSLAFSSCSSLTSITVSWDVPLTVDSSIFSSVNTSNIILYVPPGTKSAYQTNSVWGKFNIVESAATSYTISASAGSGGSISPNGTVTVNYGNNQTFYFTLNTGYEISQVTVDGWVNATAKTNGYYTFSNVTANHTISVTFKQKEAPIYTITASAGSGGSISPNGTVTVNYGNNQTFYFTPNTGYEISQVTVNGWVNATAKTNGYYTFSNVTASHTISVTFKQKEIPTYTITASAGSGGSIVPNGTVTVNSGNSQTFYVTPNTGYEINQVTIDGSVNATAKTNGYYTFSNVTANHTISVTFNIKQYTVSASAGSGGSISPSGNITVNSGNNQTFYFTPSNGYEINQVTIDGSVNATAKTNGYYTFSNVTANHTISVTFNIKQYTVSASAGSGGSISPSGNITVNSGNSQTFYFTPNTGYEINQVTVDGSVNATAKANGYYTFSNVIANHTISVTFKQKETPTYTITASAGSGGSISPSGTVIINSGNSQTFYFTPNTGYEINQVTIDGSVNATAKTNGYYIFSNVTANHTISVTFNIKQYTVSASAGSGGSISPSGNITVNSGNSQTFYFTPNTGYEINQVTVDGSVNATAKTNGYYTFSNVTANHTISVTFNIKQYTVSASAGSGGSIYPSGTVIANYGTSLTFTIMPNSNYKVSRVLIDETDNASVANRYYTFANITANHSIAAYFEPLCVPNLIVQVWDDVLSVINEPANNGGYTFTSYQWQRNGEDIAGETSGNLYLSGINIMPASYSCRLITSSGQSIQTCAVQWSAVSEITAYPNPTTGLVTIESALIKAGDIISVYDATGTLIRQQQAAESMQTMLDISSLAKGVYIVKANERQAKVIKVN